MIPSHELAFSRRRLTPVQIGLLIFIAILFLANATLAIGAFVNINATNDAFAGGYLVTDLSKIQREILRLHLDTQQYLLDDEMSIDALRLRRSLLETQIRQAIGEISGNVQVLDSINEMEAELVQFDRLLADLAIDPSPERRQAAVPEFEVMFERLELEIISTTNREDARLFETIGNALNSQRNYQTFLLTLSSLFLISIILLILSFRQTIGLDFDRAYSLLSQELSERKRIEVELVSARNEAEKANQAKSEFISLVSHELKVPMTSIQGYADLLLDGAGGPVSEDQKRFLNTIRGSISQMVRLVSDLSDISRIESGHLDLEFDRIPVGMLLDQVASANMAAINEKNQDLVIEVPDELPPIWGDQMRLVQIMNNLVSNAHKYTPENGTIKIRAEEDDLSEAGERSMIQITVEDSGLGIHPDEQAQIFGKFYRATDEEARINPGTGLGLSITRYLVEMHEGHIWFESIFRKGTQFHFTIPIFQQEND